MQLFMGGAMRIIVITVAFLVYLFCARHCESIFNIDYLFNSDVNSVKSCVVVISHLGKLRFKEVKCPKDTADGGQRQDSVKLRAGAPGRRKTISARGVSV